MRLLRNLATIGLSLIANRAFAQDIGVDPLAISPGTEVRISKSVDGKHFQRATIIKTDRDSLRVDFPRSDAVSAIAWNQVSRMEVRTGRHSNFWKGLGIGLLAGAATGALIGSSSASGNDGETPSAVGALGAIGGAIFGASTGALLGIVLRTERWRPVALQSLATSVR
jgi:hypothetical protein